MSSSRSQNNNVRTLGISDSDATPWNSRKYIEKNNAPIL